MPPKMTKAEKAIHKLSELNKLVFALRAAGRASRARDAGASVLKEPHETWNETESNEPSR